MVLFCCLALKLLSFAYKILLSEDKSVLSKNPSFARKINKKSDIADFVSFVGFF